MYKKISKTIFLVVFLMFYGIMKVNAENEVAKCVYTLAEKGSECDGDKCGVDDNTNNTQVVYVYADGYVAFDEKKSGQYSTDAIKNWESSVGGFSGHKYFFDDNKKCPPWLIINYEKVGNSKVYFSDEKRKEYVKDSTFECNCNTPLCIGTYDCEEDDYNGFKLDKKATEYYTTSNSNSNKKSISCASKSKENYTDPTVSNTEPLEGEFTTYSCGDDFITGIPLKLPKFTRFVYNFIQFLVPLLLIILGSIDLIKSITGGKEDEIKKGQQVFVKRLIAGGLVFFSLALVKLIVTILVQQEKSSKIVKCMNCFLNNGTYCKREADTPSFTYSHISDSNDVSCVEVDAK